MSEEIARRHDVHEQVNARAAAQSALQALNGALLYIDDARRRSVELGDTPGLMLGLENLTKFLAQFKIILDAVKHDLGEMLTDSWTPVPHGEGWIERGKDYTDTWDSQAVLAEVVRLALDAYLQLHEGEVESVMDLVEVIKNAVYECAPLTASTSWRVGPLRERGLDIDAYRVRKERPTVKWAAEPPPNRRTKLVLKRERSG